MIELQEDDFSIDEALKKIQTPEVGAVVSFIGIVRGISKVKSEKVKALEYEIYLEMALKKLAELEQAAKDAYEIHDILIIHRIKKLDVGENVVLIAVAAAHREPAFKACEFIINELKKVVPIWKKEITEQDEHWVEAE